MPGAALKLHNEDNVLIALRDLHKGEPVDLPNHHFSLASDVPAKHKFATKDLTPGDAVRMYGVLVGKATQPIQTGLGTAHPECAARSFAVPRKVG